MVTPTSDERRKVASALRGDPNDTLIPQSRDGFEGMTYHEAAYRFWDMCRRIKSAGVVHIDVARNTPIVLAKLIDVPTCHMTSLGSFTSPHDFTRWECDRCGGDTFTSYKWEVPRFCSNCGARLVSDDGQ